LLLDLGARGRTKKKAAGKGCVLAVCIEVGADSVNIDAGSARKNNAVKSMR
jgi:hypothetical protein